LPEGGHAARACRIASACGDAAPGGQPDIRAAHASDARISFAACRPGFDNGLASQTAKSMSNVRTAGSWSPLAAPVSAGFRGGQAAVRRAPRALVPGIRWVRRLRLEAVTSSA
jgi:hypothetical protein